MNEKLKVGDRVCLLYMRGELSVQPGDCGVVTKINNVLGDVGYDVNWDNGSKLSLWGDSDAWKWVFFGDICY
jgi:hypothetical protein